MINYKIPKIYFDRYLFRIELHTHTKPASKCSDIIPEKLVETYESLGYDGVVITNHVRPGYSMEDCLRHQTDYYNAKKAAVKIKVYFGVEMTFSDLYDDFLIYGAAPGEMPEMYRFCNEGYKSFIGSPVKKRCIVFTAHPYRNDRVNSDVHIPEIADGIEVFNMHPRVNSDNGFVSRTAWKMGYLTICGTDYHHETHEGMCAILAKELPDDENGLCRLLKSGDYLFEINGNVIIPSHLMIKQ